MKYVIIIQGTDFVFSKFRYISLQYARRKILGIFCRLRFVLRTPDSKNPERWENRTTEIFAV